MLMRLTLSHPAREKGHQVRVMGVLSAGVRIFNEIAMHTRAAQASNRMAKANRASHGPRVSFHTQAKAKVRKTVENPKKNPKEPKVPTKVPKAYTKAKHRKAGLSGLENSKSDASSDIQESAHTPRTFPGAVVGIVTNVTMAGVLLDGTMVGNKRMTLPQAHFHLEVWILVPSVV